MIIPILQASNKCWRQRWVVVLHISNLRIFFAGFTIKEVVSEQWCWLWIKFIQVAVKCLQSSIHCCRQLVRDGFKPNRRLPGGCVRFWPVSMVLNNDNRPEVDRTGGQLAVGFWSRPLGLSSTFNYVDMSSTWENHADIDIKNISRHILTC